MFPPPRVLYRSTEMNELIQIDPPVNVHSSSDYNYTFVTVNRREKFIFHVRPDFYVSVPPDSYIETGVSTPPSSPLASECSGLAGFAVTVSGRTVTSSWQPHPLPVVHSVQINFTPVFVGDCMNITGVNSSVLTSNTEIGELRKLATLNYWSRYIVEAYGLTLTGVSTASVFTTLETEVGVPTGTPTSLHLISPANVTQVTLNWELPLCEERQGPFKSFVVHLDPNTDEVEMQYSSDSQTRKPPLHIVGLLPQTTYFLTVAFENTAGIGPVAEIVFRTQAKGDVTGVRVLKQSNNEVFVTWLAPDTNHDHGTLTGFEVEYWPQSNVSSHIKSVQIPPAETQHWIRNLTAGITYQMQIFSLYQQARIGSGLISFETVPHPYGPSWVSLQLLDRSSSTIMVNWSVNGTSFPVEVNYEVTVTLLRSLLPVTPNFSTITRLVSDDGIRKLSFTDLLPASEYHITLSKQEAESVDIKDAGLNVWTLPVPFTPSPRLKIGDMQIVSQSNNSVVVNFPEINGYDGGPLNGFYIAVVENVEFNAMPTLNSYDTSRLACEY
ncbi:uncharacterized protein DEA37_0008255 [Paragonimus westermani]|uniref:Fibronectin type-III domain-containing protein n=1 Tax=Paragonimus westermani TaxID=34504 RepID=A0A5J4NA03_9TREM|nr:uncharacterized protein DEA37_0008255 [Paragonimus westermani]